MKRFKVILKKLHRKEVYLAVGLMLFLASNAHAAGTNDPDLSGIDTTIKDLISGRAGFLFIILDLIFGLIMAVTKKNYWVLAGTVLVAILIKEAPDIIDGYTGGTSGGTGTP